MKSDTTYRSQTRLHNFCVYALLLGGALIFAWPFLWMATTSVKVDREMFAEKIRLWPQRPIPVVKSPYIDTRFFANLPEKRSDEVLSIVEQKLGELRHGLKGSVSSGPNIVPVIFCGIRVRSKYSRLVTTQVASRRGMPPE
jgi:ABC-type glycerol-3-phosphate transport system permease component